MCPVSSPKDPIPDNQVADWVKLFKKAFVFRQFRLDNELKLPAPDYLHIDGVHPKDAIMALSGCKEAMHELKLPEQFPPFGIKTKPIVRLIKVLDGRAKAQELHRVIGYDPRMKRSCSSIFQKPKETFTKKWRQCKKQGLALVDRKTFLSCLEAAGARACLCDHLLNYCDRHQLLAPSANVARKAKRAFLQYRKLINQAHQQGKVCLVSAYSERYKVDENLRANHVLLAPPGSKEEPLKLQDPGYLKNEPGDYPLATLKIFDFIYIASPPKRHAKGTPASTT